jgi:hypothetical protein
MTVKALPGSPLEVVGAEFSFQLLMGLLAYPSCLDGGGQTHFCSGIGTSRALGQGQIAVNCKSFSGK